MIRTWIDWDWVGAESEWRRALELDPNAANVHAYYAHFLAITGHIGEALPHSERALELDPFNALFHGLYAHTLLYQRRNEEALAASQTALAIQSDQWVAQAALYQSLYLSGIREELLIRQREYIAHDPERLALFEQGLAEAGYQGVQQHLADYRAARHGTSDGTLATDIALQYLEAGNSDRALEFLEKAYEERDPTLPYIGQPLWDPLRSDPRFQELLRKMNLPMEK